MEEVKHTGRVGVPRGVQEWSVYRTCVGSEGHNQYPICWGFGLHRRAVQAPDIPGEKASDALNTVSDQVLHYK